MPPFGLRPLVEGVHADLARESFDVFTVSGRQSVAGCVQAPRGDGKPECVLGRVVPSACDGERARHRVARAARVDDFELRNLCLEQAPVQKRQDRLAAAGDDDITCAGYVELVDGADELIDRVAPGVPIAYDLFVAELDELDTAFEHGGELGA